LSKLLGSERPAALWQIYVSFERWSAANCEYINRMRTIEYVLANGK
jgi:hypothetical protein